MLYAAFDGDERNQVVKEILLTDCLTCANVYKNVMMNPESPPLDDAGIYFDRVEEGFGKILGPHKVEFKRKFGECADAHV